MEQNEQPVTHFALSSVTFVLMLLLRVLTPLLFSQHPLPVSVGSCIPRFVCLISSPFSVILCFFGVSYFFVIVVIGECYVMCHEILKVRVTWKEPMYLASD